MQQIGFSFKPAVKSHTIDLNEPLPFHVHQEMIKRRDEIIGDTPVKESPLFHAYKQFFYRGVPYPYSMYFAVYGDPR